MAVKIIEDLKTYGYALASNIFHETHLAYVTPILQSMIDKWYSNEIDDNDYWFYERKNKEKLLYRIHNLETKHPCIKELIEVEEFKRLIHSVMDTDVIPTAFALIIKLPFLTAGVPWHRDTVAVEPGRVFNFSVYFDNSNLQNGCLEVIPRSHFWPNEVPISKNRPENAIAVPARRGDVIIHDVRIVHGSGRPLVPKQRLSICIEVQPIHVALKLNPKLREFN
jgi:phytanoyl-CoA hydroxylase